MNNTTLIITPSMVKILEGHGFYYDDFIADQCKFLDSDKVVCSYRGFSIGLIIPNGGIIGVSFWRGVNVNFNGFSKLTEHLESFPGHQNEDGHIDLAKAAIDAMLGPIPRR